MIAETVQEVEVKTEQEEPAIKVEEQEGPAVVEEGGHDVVTTEETSNVAINYSQSASQLVYHNDGTYIEYAYQVTQHTNIYNYICNIYYILYILGKVSYFSSPFQLLLPC